MSWHAARRRLASWHALSPIPTSAIDTLHLNVPTARVLRTPAGVSAFHWTSRPGSVCCVAPRATSPVVWCTAFRARMGGVSYVTERCFVRRLAASRAHCLVNPRAVSHARPKEGVRYGVSCVFFHVPRAASHVPQESILCALSRAPPCSIRRALWRRLGCLDILNVASRAPPGVISCVASRAQRCLLRGALCRHFLCGPGRCFQRPRPSFCPKRLRSPSGILCIPGRQPVRFLVTSRVSQDGILVHSLARRLATIPRASCLWHLGELLASFLVPCVSIRSLHAARTQSTSPRGATGAASRRRHVTSRISTAALPHRGLSNYLPQASWKRRAPGQHLGDGAQCFGGPQPVP